MNDRSEMERNRGGAFTTNAVNPRYPMFQLPGLHSAGMATATAAAQPPSTPSSAAAKEDEFVSLEGRTRLNLDISSGPALPFIVLLSLKGHF